MLDSRLEHIKDKLARLQRCDRRHVVFGASKHQYRLNPALSLEQVDAFERSYRISLPAEYRAFITSIGNGGAGPDYGVFSLSDIVQEVTSMHDGMLPPQFFAQPFDSPQTQDQAEALDYPAPGTAPISDQGCGYMAVLIVSGPERGNVWLWPHSYIPHPPPHSSPRYEPGQNLQQQNDAWQAWAAGLLSPANTYRIGFFAWYEQWLDKNLAAYTHRTHPFNK